MSPTAANTVPTPAASTTPRSRKGALTRARLIEAGKAVFEETGFLEARISDIADRAGLSHGSFYHYFESKEQIFREVAEEQEARLTAPDTTASPKPHDASRIISPEPGSFGLAVKRTPDRSEGNIACTLTAVPTTWRTS